MPRKPSAEGAQKEKGGYLFIKVKDHPKFGTNWVKAHFLALAEGGRPLPDWKNKREIVHHKDGDKKNNSLDNLEVISQAEHVKIHLPMKGKKHSEETKQKLSKAKLGNKTASGKSKVERQSRKYLLA